MVYAGVDLIEISRLKRCVQRPHFMQRVFSEEERTLFLSKGNPLPTIAANFAAKEAFGKAMGTGVRGFSLTEVAALRDGAGRPYLHLTGRAKQLAEQRGMNFSVSISHTKEYAICFVTAVSDHE